MSDTNPPSADDVRRARYLARRYEAVGLVAPPIVGPLDPTSTRAYVRSRPPAPGLPPLGPRFDPIPPISMTDRRVEPPLTAAIRGIGWALATFALLAAAFLAGMFYQAWLAGVPVG